MRIQPTSQNRARLSGFSLHEQHILRCRQRWHIEGDVAVRDFLLLQTSKVPGEGMVLGSDDTILVPNGIDVLNVTVAATGRCISFNDDHLLFWIGTRAVVDPEKLAYYRLPADKARTDPDQMRIFEELSPPRK